MGCNCSTCKENHGCCGKCHKCKCHECCHHDKCEEVQKEFHEMINKANEIFAAAYEAQAEAFEEAIEAFESAKEFTFLNTEGNLLEEKAYELLAESGCDKTPCKCKELLNKANCYYALQSKQLAEATSLLAQAICMIKQANCSLEQGERFYNKYVKCVHEKKDCDCK